MNFLTIVRDELGRGGKKAAAGLLFFLLLCGCVAQAEAAWTAAGPYGGDARSITGVPGEPRHLYLGSTTSWLYESTDGGATWRRLAKLDDTNRLILDSVLVDPSDPKTIFVGAWRAERPDGGLWISHDGGHSWKISEPLRGQSIRSMAEAPSDPKILFAGSLEGVFRSMDRGESWTQISPRGSKEIHEIESLAVDPKNPHIVYAGTWHLPWKTVNGGKSWSNLKQGIIDDSDVFSIIVDAKFPRTVFLSACSGIYKSESAGERFHKIQGIPADARRTRVLMQDPSRRDVVYAGTTQGLYKTVDGGRSFRAMTDDNVIVNDVYVDPENSNRVLLATDRGGVLASEDAGRTFKGSNEGFSARSVQALLVDRADAQRIWAGVINDKEFGGAFISSDGGAHWRQLARGLDGRDVYALAQAEDGSIVAGTSRGVFVLNEQGEKDGKKNSDPVWEPRNTLANTVTKIATEKVRGKQISVEKQSKEPVIELESRVNALDVSGKVWVAGTSYGLVTSRNQGVTWQGGPVLGLGDFLAVAVQGETMAAARGDRVVISHDAGKNWWPLGLPKMMTRIHCLVFSADGTLWLGAREGIYFTRDQGKTWMWIERLAFRDVDELFYDAASGRIVASSQKSDEIYSIDPKTMTWKYWRTGYAISLVRMAAGKLVIASNDDGVVVETLRPDATQGK